MRRWLVAVFAIAVSLGVSGAAAAQCEAVEAKVDSMHVEMTGSFADIDGKFDSAWAALDSMDQLLFQIAVDVEDSYYGLYNAIGSDHVDIYTREQEILDSVATLNLEMTASFADVGGKLDSAETRLDSMDQLLFQIAVDVEDSYYGLYNAIGSDHVDIYTREQQILDSVAAVDIKIDSLAGELAAVNSRIDGLEALLNQVLQAIDALPFRSIPGRP